MRLVPETANRPDWPRLVAGAINSLQNAFATATDYAALGDYADDAAAAAGGVEVGQIYRTGNALKVRIS